MMTAKTRRAWISAGIFVVVLAGLVILFIATPLRELFTSPESLRDNVRHLGYLAPVMMVGIYVAQVILAPIPGQTIDLANGYLFGWWGIAVSLIGLFLGSTLAILLARQFGRPVVEIFVTPKGLEKARPYIRRRSQWLFFMLFLLPGTPDDLLCYAIGLSSIPLRRSILIALLGRTPAVTATVIIGATGQKLSPLEFSLMALAMTGVVAVLLWFWPPTKKLVTSAMPTP